MKKLSNVLFWIICVGSIVIGGLLLSIGISLGGATSFSIGSNGLNFYHDFSFSNDKVALLSNIINDEVYAIKLDLEFTEVIITSGDEFTINHTSDVAYKVRNNTLEITSNSSTSNRFGMRLRPISNSFVKITIPDHIAILDVDTSSKTTLSDVAFDDIELDIDLGDTLIENTTANTFAIDANLGHIEIHACSFDALEVELDMGNLTTSTLEVITSAKFKNDMGSLDIDLSGDESDYNFITSVDMGSLSINGKDTPEFYGLIDIMTETTMGSVKITTK